MQEDKCVVGRKGGVEDGVERGYRGGMLGTRGRAAEPGGALRGCLRFATSPAKSSDTRETGR